MNATQAERTANMPRFLTQRLIPGLGNAVNQPNKNFGPDLGFAWDPMKNGKTSIRGGIGIFWENAIWNNVLFDGPYREPTGAFAQFPGPCAAAGEPSPLQTPSGPITPSAAVCGTASGGFPLIGNAVPAVVALSKEYQAASPLNVQEPNPGFAGQYLTGCSDGSNCFFQSGTNLFNPNYRSPRSVVMNIGVQRELRPGHGIERGLHPQRSDPLPAGSGSESRRRHTLL